jgi:catechol 2,3-dioxygenase-like lactoylglutathione lyase family enzyme
VFEGAQVNLYCDDVEACAEFYRVLGCTERFRVQGEGAPSHVEVTGPGFTIGLTSAAAGNELGLDVHPGHSSAELVFWCADSDTAYAAALAAGGRTVHEPVDSVDGRLHYGWVADPAGHLLKLVQKL